SEHRWSPSKGAGSNPSHRGIVSAENTVPLYFHVQIGELGEALYKILSNPIQMLHLSRRCRLNKADERIVTMFQPIFTTPALSKNSETVTCPFPPHMKHLAASLPLLLFFSIPH